MNTSKILYITFKDSSPHIEKIIKNVTRINIFKHKIPNDDFNLIIMEGGTPGIPKAADIFKYYNIPLSENIPVIGICYGMQILYKYWYNKNPVLLPERNKSNQKLIIDNRFSISNLFSSNKNYKFNHKFYCPAVDGVVAKTNNDIPAVIKFSDKHYGLQFHPDLKTIKNIIEFLI
jgi:anthranilate/para-aminobenzoate synthase component II